MALFASCGDHHGGARVSASYAQVIWYQGHDVEGAVERMERALEDLTADEPGEDVAVLSAQLGRFLYFAGRLDDAAKRLEEALELAEGLHLPAVFAEALNSKSLGLSSRGRFEESTLLLRHALAVALQHDLGAASLRAYNNLCALYDVTSRHEEELEMAREGVELARRLGDRRMELQLLACHISPLFMLGCWDEALERVAELMATDELMGAALAIELSTTVPLCVERGEQDALDRFLGLLAEQEHESVESAFMRLARARALRGQGRHSEAVALVREAESGPVELNEKVEALVETLENLTALGERAGLSARLAEASAWRPGEITPYLRAQLSRFAARDAAWRGESEAADNAFRKAASAFRELGMPFYTAVAELEYGEWLVTEGRVEEAEPLLATARDSFAALKARPWLERLDAASPTTVAAR